MERNKKVYIVVRETDQSSFSEPRYWAGANPYTDILIVADDKKKAEQYAEECDVWKEDPDKDELNPYFEIKIIETELDKWICD